MKVFYADWTKKENQQRLFYDILEHKFNSKEIVKLYDITTDDVSQFGGEGLLKYIYDGSLAKALTSIFPNHEWYSWIFNQRLYKGFWEDKKNQFRFMNWLGKELGFKEMSDWYKLELRHVYNNGASRLINKFGNSPSKLVQSIFPQHEWRMESFNNIKKSAPTINRSQRDLAQVLEILPIGLYCLQ